jgi:hypothetical protein
MRIWGGYVCITTTTTTTTTTATTTTTKAAVSPITKKVLTPDDGHIGRNM